MKFQQVGKLNLKIAGDKIHFFFSFLRQGFMVETPVGCSVKTMLHNTLGMDDNYVEARIKTIFLDAKPVDDINSACINDGSVLALSGAMPGLAGATLRRGGHLASFRGSISCRSDGNNTCHQVSVTAATAFLIAGGLHDIAGVELVEKCSAAY